MKNQTSTWDSLLIVAIVLIAGLCAQAQQSLHAQEEAEGTVVQIAPDAAAEDLVVGPQTRIVEEPSYWIGISGRSIESAALRTHLQLAEEMGVVVEQIIPDSPAAKAGLRKHDILLRVNGDAVDNMQILQDQVRSGKDKPLKLSIIRLGKEEKVVVVPELRPENFSNPNDNPSRFNLGGPQADVMGQLMEQLGARNIGPGLDFRGGGRFNLNQMPNGVSVSIQRQNNGIAQITVKKGDQTWQVEDNEESLQQLPADIRPFVERMLKGGQSHPAIGGLGLDFNRELEQILPRNLGGFQRGLGVAPDPTQKRIDELERKLQKLMQRLENE